MGQRYKVRAGELIDWSHYVTLGELAGATGWDGPEIASLIERGWLPLPRPVFGRDRENLFWTVSEVLFPVAALLGRPYPAPAAKGKRGAAYRTITAAGLKIFALRQQSPEDAARVDRVMLEASQKTEAKRERKRRE